MLKWINLEKSVLLTDAIFAFCCALIVSAASNIINQQNEIQKEIKELRADVEELYLRVDNSK